MYVLTLPDDADNDVDLTIQPGQVAHVKAGIKAGVARALRWGAGGFTLGGGAALTLEGLEISGPIVAAADASLVLKLVTFADGGCVLGDATLIDTPTPEVCLLNVIFDGPDVDAFLASLGSGLPGTYVLRLAGKAQAFEVCRRTCDTRSPASMLLDSLNTAWSSSKRELRLTPTGLRPGGRALGRAAAAGGLLLHRVRQQPDLHGQR
jgi:hypothetical protein